MEKTVEMAVLSHFWHFFHFDFCYELEKYPYFPFTMWCVFGKIDYSPIRRFLLLCSAWDFLLFILLFFVSLVQFFGQRIFSFIQKVFSHCLFIGRFSRSLGVPVKETAVTALQSLSHRPVRKSPGSGSQGFPPLFAP